MCQSYIESVEAGEVGPWTPSSRMMTALYIGSIKKLKGLTALISPEGDDLCVVQFSNRSCGYAYGWWLMQSKDFLVTDELYGLYVELNGIDCAFDQVYFVRQRDELVQRQSEILGRIKEIERERNG